MGLVPALRGRFARGRFVRGEHVVWREVPHEPVERKALGPRLFRVRVHHHGGGHTDGFVHGSFSGTDPQVFVVDDGLSGDRGVRGLGGMESFREYAEWEE